MRIFYFFLSMALITMLSSCTAEDQFDPNLVEKISIESVEKGSTYPIWIYLPEDYYSSAETYPVIYVLDAEDNQQFIAAKCTSISARLQTKNAIVVGIGYGDDRDTDYTPTHTNLGNGEAQLFLNFIANELIPMMEANYRAQPGRNARAIIGHSFGGLFGAFAFTKNNEVFGNYLLLSASLFYDNDIVLQYEQAVRHQIKSNSQLVYIGVGGAEGPLLVANDLLNRRLKTNYTQTQLKFNIVTGKGHLTSKNPNIEKALLFYFKNRL